MAENNEEIKYSYTGDTSSLKKATQSAVNQLDKFEKKLRSVGDVGIGSKFGASMKKATEPLAKGLDNISSKFAKSLDAIQGKSKTFENSMARAKQYLADGFSPVTNKFQQLRKDFDSLSPRLQTLKDKSSSTFRGMSQLMANVSSAFRRTTKAEDAEASSAKRNAAATKAATDAKKKAKDASDKNKKSATNLSDSMKKLNSDLAKNTKGFKTMSSSMKETSAIASTLSDALKIFTGVKMGEWLANSVKQSMDYIENLNLFSVAMGEAIDKGTAFVDKMQEIYGMDPSTLMRYVGNFYQLADAIEMPESAAATMSLTLTKMTNDIASLFNMPIETVFENLQSGMQGMSRAVRKYGMDIRVTTLQQTALSLGIDAQVERMSEANRMGLRFITMMRQAQNASGDFARTIESPSNQLRILKEQITQLGRAIGNFFIVPLQNALAYINGFVMAIRKVLTFIATLLGFQQQATVSVDKGMSGASGAIEGVGDSAKDAAKKVKQLLGPMDELNILSEDTAAAGGGVDVGAGMGTLDPAIADEIAKMDAQFESIQMRANKIRDTILEFLGFDYTVTGELVWDSEKLRANLLDKFPEWTKTINAAFDNWSGIVEGFQNVFNAMGGVIGRVMEKLRNFFGLFINDETVSSFIENLAGNLNNLADWITEHENTLANFIILLGGMWAGFKAFQGISSLLAPVATFITTVSGALGPFATLLSTVGIVTSAIVILYQNSEDFATSFDTFVGTFVTGLGAILSGGWSALSGIASDIGKLWNDKLQPMVGDLGSLVGGVLDTLGSLWTNVSNIVSGAFGLIEDLWTTALSPTLGDLADNLGELMQVFTKLWNEHVSPVLTSMGDLFEQVWNDVISPIVGFIIEILGSLGEAFNAVVRDYVVPFVTYIVETFGPMINTVFEGLIEIVSGLVTALGGLVDFVIGVFTGDWDRAWKGIQNVFIGVVNGIISAFEACVNFIIDLVNGMIAKVTKAFSDFVKGLLELADPILDFIGIDIEVNFDIAPYQIPHLSVPRVPALAAGGVVTGPTHALIGEGAYDEAVIPLGQSPQMQELVKEIADAVRGGSPGAESSGETVLDITVNLDGQVIYKNQEKIKRQRGYNFDQGGFAR